MGHVAGSHEELDRYVCVAPKGIVLNGFGMKKGMDFSPRSKIGCGKSQILV